MTSPVGPQILVQQFVERVHFYSAVSITAQFEAELAHDGFEYLDTKYGTAFLVVYAGEFHFITNRHVLDYNFQRPASTIVHSARLKSIGFRGHSQPLDQSQPTIPWAFEQEADGVKFHPDASTDLAAVGFQYDAKKPPFSTTPGLLNVLGHYNANWLATESELALLTPGAEVFIVGYPGLAGASDRPVLVTGILASDPRYPATFGNAQLHNAVLCQSFSWQGMSGAPVLGFSDAIGRSKIIGINAGHVGGSGISGGVISHFVRSSALLELLA